MFWFDLIWFDLIWFDLIWFDLIWFDLICFAFDLMIQSVRSLLILLTFCFYSSAFDFVTYGSIIKLGHVAVDCRLHSHEVNYGTGDGSSGQQSVTCYPGTDDPNSLWVVKVGYSIVDLSIVWSAVVLLCQSKAPTGKTTVRGKKVKNGDLIRLQHAKTKLNLHAHNHRSPLTRWSEYANRLMVV